MSTALKIQAARKDARLTLVSSLADKLVQQYKDDMAKADSEVCE